MCAFVVLGLVFAIPSQELGLGKRLRSDLFYVEWDIKPQLNQSMLSFSLGLKVRSHRMRCRAALRRASCVIFPATRRSLPRYSGSSDHAGSSGRVFSASDRGVRIHVRITPRTVVFISTTAEIFSFGHWLRTFTAVPMSTQSSTLCRTVK